MQLLKIDNRERKFIDLLKFDTAFYNSHQSQIIFESLNIGDFEIIISNSSDNNNETFRRFIFERKTISDLYSSINDGRYHEQKSRLQQSINDDNVKVCYIIEGDIYSTSNTNCIFGAILNTMFRDNIQIYRTTSLNDTYNFIKSLFTRVLKNSKKWEEYFINNKDNNNVDPKVYKNVQIKKSENLTKEVVFINSLNNIKGCSSVIAKAIYQEYTSMKELVNAFEDSDNPELMLKDIKVGSRKIGPVLSKRIYEFIM